MIINRSCPILLCSTFLACAATGESSESVIQSSDDVGASASCCEATELDMPYDIEIQCGDTTIPVLDAFRENNGGHLRFAPAPSTTADCPVQIEGAAIRAAEVSSCAPLVATAADARTEGNQAAGRDRVMVTWCWYADDLVLDDAAGCCIPPVAADGAVECATDHLDIRFSCDGGRGVPAGAGQLLDPGMPPLCTCSDPDGCDPGSGMPGDDCTTDGDCGAGEFCLDRTCWPSIE